MRGQLAGLPQLQAQGARLQGVTASARHAALLPPVSSSIAEPPCSIHRCRPTSACSAAVMQPPHLAGSCPCSLLSCSVLRGVRAKGAQTDAACAPGQRCGAAGATGSQTSLAAAVPRPRRRRGPSKPRQPPHRRPVPSQLCQRRQGPGVPPRGRHPASQAVVLQRQRLQAREGAGRAPAGGQRPAQAVAEQAPAGGR